jgi:IclR family KDG regulon transcriptional repressor
LTTGEERPVNAARYPIQAVEKALSIIRVLAEVPGQKALGVTEIARLIGVTKSTTHRLLATLVEHSFVARDADGGRYRLGWAFYQAAQRLPQAGGVLDLAQPLLQEACSALGETVNLAVRQGAHMTIIDSQEVPSGLKVETPKGVSQPLHNSAVGKALLLDFDEAALRQLLGPGPYEVTASQTLTSCERLWANLSSARDQGYTLDDEEAIDGVRCLGAPVRDYRREIVAAVSVTGPRQRLTGDKFAETADRVRRLSLEISRRIGFTGGSIL